MEDVGAWAERQWGGVDLGDKRRTHRAVAMGAAMAEQPSAGLPRQTGGWSAAKAAYRLLDRPEATLEAVTAPHRAETRRAAQAASGPVLFVHDDTTIDLSDHHAMEGRGRIGDDRGRGLLAHGCLAVALGPDADAVLGLAAIAAWSRPEGSAARGESKAERNARRTEADVWAECVEAVGPCPEGATWVSVGDRGADVFSHLDRARALGWHALVRVCQNRRIEGGGGLVDELRALPPMSRRRIPVREGGRRGETEASVAWTGLVVRPARLRRDGRAPLPCAGIRVWADGVEWLLLSTLPVETGAEAQERVGRYARRWLVEEFHKGLKSGCRLEARQVRTAGRFLPLLGFLAVVAVRPLQVRDAARVRPEAPAGEARETVALLAAALGVPEAEVSTARGFHRGVARSGVPLGTTLGGFLARKGDGEPGWQTLWGGFERFALILLGADLAKRMALP